MYYEPDSSFAKAVVGNATEGVAAASANVAIASSPRFIIFFMKPIPFLRQSHAGE